MSSNNSCGGELGGRLTSLSVWLVIFWDIYFCVFRKSRAILKMQKFCCPSVKRTNRVSIPGLHVHVLLYSSQQKRVSKCVSKCAFDAKCYVTTDAWSRQGRKVKSGSNHRRSQIHWLRKLKAGKFLKSEFWAISRKFVPAKITNHTVCEKRCQAVGDFA